MHSLNCLTTSQLAPRLACQDTSALLKGEWRAANPNSDDPELQDVKIVTAAWNGRGEDVDGEAGDQRKEVGERMLEG